MTLIDVFQDSIARYKNLPALCMRPRYRTLSWSYQDLGKAADLIASHLAFAGVGVGDKVLLWAPNSPYWVASFFGILLRGGVAVPLHLENTREFIEKIQKQTSAKILIKQSALKIQLASLASMDVDLLPFGETAEGVKSMGGPKITEEDLAEIVYTSGTTGDPKGVMLTHRNLLSNIKGVARAISINERDCFLSILPLSHMFEQTAGLLFPLSRGAKIIYLPRVSSGLIVRALQEHHVTKLLAVPQFLDTVMKKIEAEADREGKTSMLETARQVAGFLPFPLRRFIFRKIHQRFGGKLRTVASGGAPLDPALERKWELLGVRLLQGYGLTETSPIISVNTYRAHRFGSIGRPLAGVEIKIAPGGEILVKGPNVFGGYYHDEKKTAESFTPEGWFRTGDVGELDEDGFLFIRGRKKYLILGPGGQNVHPEDIEFELNKRPGVRDSAVVGWGEGSRVEICAVLLLESGVDPEKVVEKANEHLLSFQKIQIWRVWPGPDFPRSATRKIQKEKVLFWLKEEKKEEVSASLATTPLTRLLGEIFEKDAATLSDQTSLVADLGLDSILRIELVTRIEELFGVALEERVITQKTTVGDLERAIQHTPHSKSRETLLKRWPFWPITKFFREISYWLVMYPFLLIFTRPKVFGQEVFEKIKGPMLIMPNHRSFLDSPVVLRALSHRIRKQLGFATGADVLKEFWWTAPLLELFYASFPFPRREQENIEPGLEAVGALIDKEWSVVLYPEGRQSETKEFLPFKKGAGLLAVEMGVPVVPVFVDGTENVLPRDHVVPKKIGEVRVYFGEPLFFQVNESYVEATEKIERAVHKLKDEDIRR